MSLYSHRNHDSLFWGAAPRHRRVKAAKVAGSVTGITAPARGWSLTGRARAHCPVPSGQRSPAPARALAVLQRSDSKHS